MRRTNDRARCGSKRFVERALGVRVQVVAHHDHFVALGVAAFQQPSHFDAQSIFVLRSRTATSRQPASGSVNMKMLAVPARSYS